MSLAAWLDAHGLTEYLSRFEEQDIDLATLAILTEEDLRELGLPLGARRRFLSARAAPPAPTEERRQMTVLFSDIIGFTALAERHDPEILREVVRGYEDACAAHVARYEGYLFQRMGDGIVAFFGFPLAHEREAERAIRAGLDIAAAIPALPLGVPAPIEVRVGIATGIVLVSSDGRAAVGETMNLAARLQAAAEPGGVVVSPRVRKLAGAAFHYRDLGECKLRGITDPVRLHGVVGPVEAGEARGIVVPLVGRATEMGALRAHWREVRESGRGRAVGLKGEPGIGKTGLSGALCEGLEHEGARILRFQCSPFHVNSAFYPIVTHIEATLRLSREASDATRLDRLEAQFRRVYGLPESDVRLIATLLAIPFGDRYAPLDLSPRAANRETVRVLRAMIEAIARAQPTLLLFEDLHWADPTSVDILDGLIAGLAALPLMAIVTYRPEFDPPWGDRSEVAALTLARLAAEQCAEMIARLTGGRPLPADLARQIIARTDGVPLFVEELTRAILESGALIETGGRFAYAGAGLGLAVPETLRDSLTARLDRLGGAKRLAQIGAVVGRSFDHEMISEIAEMGPKALARGLDQLTGSGLVSSRGGGGRARYTFKHALVQEAAYETLPLTQRRALHARIAQYLDASDPTRREREPELLAHHFTLAGATEVAVPFWFRAGEIALARFALPEALSHLRQGLALVQGLPPGAERDLAELRIRAALGPALVAAHGWGHPEVSAVLEPAWALARKLGHRAGYLPILNAIWVHHMASGRLALSMIWAEELLSAARSVGDTGLAMVGHRACSASAFWLGEFDAARDHSALLMEGYDAEAHWGIAQLTHTDPLTGDGIYRAQYLWITGFPDQALAATRATEEHARRRAYPFDLAFALTLGAQVYDFVGRPGELARRAAEADAVGQRYGLPLFCEIMAELSRGLALLGEARHAEGSARLGEAVSRLGSTGHGIWLWYLRARVATGLAESGEMDAAGRLIDECLARSEAREERSHHAEILRLRGCLRERRGEYDAAERDYRAAIEEARARSARSWELRAAHSLAGLLDRRGAAAAAVDVLAPVLGGFTEGFDTPDLRAAAEFLRALGAGREEPCGIGPMND